MLVDGKTVAMVRDVSETDRYGRSLRYVNVDGVFVNRAQAQFSFVGYDRIVLRPDRSHCERRIVAK